MIRLVLLVGVAVFAYPSVRLAAQPNDVLALQNAVHKLIDDTEPAITCILVSRSDRYADFRAAPSPLTPWRLGGFNPPALGPFLEGSRRELIKRLDLANLDGPPEAYGSGVVIDAERGLVLTNYHVIRDATKIYVRLPNNKGSYADIHAADGRSDLAVLRLIQKQPELKALRFGDGEKVRKGDWVVSMANPFAAGFRDGSPSASWGILSNVRRRAPGTGTEADRVKQLHQYGTLLQTDARLNLGCSGGALLNLKGELIGLTTSIAAISGGESAGGYAVPMDASMRRILDVLKRGEEVEYGFLGVSLVTETVGERRVKIERVSEGTPASRAGLSDGETILSINGHEIRDLDETFLQIGITLAGNEATVEVVANQFPRKVKVRLAKFSNPFPVIASNRPAALHGLRIDYSSVVNSEFRVPDGVSVRELDRGSAAERKLKELVEKSPLIITHVNQKIVRTPAEFHEIVKELKGSVELKLVEIGPKPGNPITITLP